MVCDICGGTRNLVEHTAKDALGWDVPVLVTCARCGRRRWRDRGALPHALRFLAAQAIRLYVGYVALTYLKVVRRVGQGRSRVVYRLLRWAIRQPRTIRSKHVRSEQGGQTDHKADAE